MSPLIPYFPVIQFTLPLPDFFPKDALVFHGFGLAVGIAIIYGATVTMDRRKRRNLDEKTFIELFFWLVFSVIIGGHIGYGLLYNPKEYLANPELFLNVTSGLSSFGGFITFSIAALCVLRRRKKPLLPYADNIMYGFSFGWIFGRLGCTLNHEHPGTASNFFLSRYCRPTEGHTLNLPDWAIQTPYDFRFSHCIDPALPAVTDISQQVSTNYSGVLAVHDMGLYEMIYAIALFSCFYLLDKKPRPHGTFLFIMIFTYAPLRFAMDFLRPLEGNARYSGLTPAQWGCIGFIVSCITMLIVYRKHLHDMMHNPQHNPSSTKG